MIEVTKGLELEKERKELLKNAKRTMKFFWEDKKMSRESFLITDVSIKLGEEKHILTITLERPGILIGKGGKDINSLTERLTKELGHPIEIHIIEDKQWHGIYS